jgi:hypothetical protein
MKTTQPSKDEKQTWRNLDRSVRRNRESSDDLNRWIKSHDRTPPKPPLFETTKQDDGCLTALLPILLVLAAGAMQALA